VEIGFNKLQNFPYCGGPPYSLAVFEILGSKHIGVTSLTLLNHVLHRPFPIGGPLELSLYI